MLYCKSDLLALRKKPRGTSLKNIVFTFSGYNPGNGEHKLMLPANTSEKYEKFNFLHWRDVELSDGFYFYVSRAHPKFRELKGGIWLCDIVYAETRDWADIFWVHPVKCLFEYL